MIKGFAAAQRQYDAREAPSCDEPEPPEYGCEGDRRALCEACRGGGMQRYGRCRECRGTGRVACGGCDWCAPVMGGDLPEPTHRECEICGRRALVGGSEPRCAEHDNERSE